MTTDAATRRAAHQGAGIRPYRPRRNHEPHNFTARKQPPRLEFQRQIGPGEIRMQAILQAVCTYYGITEEEARGRDRAAPLAEARQVCMAVLHTQNTWTVAAIGHFLDRDHSTVLHGINRAKDAYAAQVEEVESIVAASVGLDPYAGRPAAMCDRDLARELAGVPEPTRAHVLAYVCGHVCGWREARARDAALGMLALGRDAGLRTVVAGVLTKLNHAHRAAQIALQLRHAGYLAASA